MSWLKAKDWATGVEYSSLFHSGLRAISLRKPRAAAYSSSSSSQENSSGGRATPSMPLPPHLVRWSKQPLSPSMTMSTESSLASQPSTPKVPYRYQSPMLAEPTKKATYAWASEESCFDMEKYPTFPEKKAFYCVPPIEIEGIRSLPSSRAFFTNAGEMERTAPGEDPFLLLSNSPLHHPDPQCECPMSMPLPPHRVRETRRNRGDGAWMLEESSPEMKVYEFEFEDARQPDDEPEDMADWRQFHVDLLATMR